MLIRYGYDFVLECTQPTPLVSMVSVHPEVEPRLVATERHETAPDLPVSTYLDGFGNRCRRLIAPAGELRMSGGGVVRDSGLIDDIDPSAAEILVEHLPDHTLVYTLGSRYCETDILMQAAWDLFGNVPPGWGRVQAICDHVHNRIAFSYAEARSTRTASQAWQEGRGVCRDFAHLAITFCRCLNIPARYVNGHLGDIGMPFSPDPMDYAAWIEVWIGGRWWTFDPRNNMRRIGRIVIARGRDAADVPMINSFGQHWLKSFTVVTEEVPEAAPTLA